MYSPERKSGDASAGEGPPALLERYCPECSYCLRGLVEPRCPECGSPFEWDHTPESPSVPGIAFFCRKRRPSVSGFLAASVCGLWPASAHRRAVAPEGWSLVRSVCYWAVWTCLFAASARVAYGCARSLVIEDSRTGLLIGAVLDDEPQIRVGPYVLTFVRPWLRLTWAEQDGLWVAIAAWPWATSAFLCLFSAIARIRCDSRMLLRLAVHVSSALPVVAGAFSTRVLVYSWLGKGWMLGSGFPYTKWTVVWYSTIAVVVLWWSLIVGRVHWSSAGPSWRFGALIVSQVLLLGTAVTLLTGN